MRTVLSEARGIGGAVIIMALVSGCASHEAQQNSANQPASKPAESASGALSSGASSGGESTGERYAMTGDAYPLEPPDVSKVPNAEPRIEPLSRSGNRSTYEVWGETYHVLPDATGYVKQGTASWYGEKFHGYATSNGEIYDMYKMSAAHRSLPLPTFARVTSLDSGQSVIVRVNDRGPFHSDREIDLSYAAAARLGFLDNGTGAVRVEAIEPEQWLAQQGRSSRPVDEVPSASSTVNARPVPNIAAQRPMAADDAIYLQIAALGSEEGAQQLQQRLVSELPHKVRVMSDADVHRVQVGPVSPNQETQAREELRRAGFPQVFIVR
ncbi:MULTISPECIES: septal ring lytic transglycosylase RlpA family protein [Halomonadaceae]|uniref:Endolytic peptidoglycan transglycosylase RlpA n=1 Tax=Vreelandella alkaliphila TaxID=272774 RepID=A0AAJ2VS98_9GAMM|nr:MULTISPECIES: septal ring lytic transglycosylase RlpA family protein [Halomonas]MCD6006325.1 septal ring lytic transglycosylase RlpA family protein [Halomonas sp. IOP_6]MDX5979424.1 septal ring lytic transglycosylase RlpA family protein [Halomonas alkaliphila]